VSADFFCKALNSKINANINDADDSESLEELIREYFSTPAAEDDHSSEEESEGEGESCAELTEGEEEMISESDDSQSDVGSDSESDQPLVEDCGINSETADISEHPDEEMRKVEGFDCRCKMKKVTVPESGKKGCIAQFSDAEVLARRLDMKEFTEGKYMYVYPFHLG
jgi:hypothetical protein